MVKPLQEQQAKSGLGENDKNKVGDCMPDCTKILLFGDLMNDGNHYEHHDQNMCETAGTQSLAGRVCCHLQYQDDYFTMKRNLNPRGVTRLLGSTRGDEYDSPAEVCAEIRRSGDSYVLQNVNMEGSVEVNGFPVPFGKYRRVYADDIVTVCKNHYDIVEGLCLSGTEKSYQENPEVQKYLQQAIKQEAVNHA